MSGPKVIRVITKEEIMEICQSRMEALRDVIDEWKRVAVRHDAMTEQEKNKIEVSYRSIVRMYEREQFKDVQKQCTSEIAFLRNDIVRIRNLAIVKAEKDRSLRRRLQYSSETLIRTFEESGLSVPEDLRQIATLAIKASEAELSSMRSILSAIVKEYTLSTMDGSNITSLQKELLEKFSEGEKLETLVEWQNRQDGNLKTSEADRRLDKLLAEIEALEDFSISQPFLDRAARIAQEPVSNLRSLLIDSLILDLVSHCKARREKEAVIASMREVHSKLRRLASKTARDLERLLIKAIDAEDIVSGNMLKDRGLALIKDETQAKNGMARREAILKGLTELGYEVRENMATAWAQDGRLIVRKPNDNSYGVELGAIADAERVQIQLVSCEQANDLPNALRDRDRETIWCSEFTRLQSLLVKSGTELAIEKEIPAGMKPLKQVKESPSSVEKDNRNSLLKQRQN